MTRTPSPIQRTPELYEMDLEQLKSKLIELLPEQQTEKRPWEDLLKGSICMGEIHWDVAPKKFLIQNMPLFKGSGFKVLFLEHLSVKEHSELLDQYFANGEMSEVLKTKLSALDEGHKDPYGDGEKRQEWDKYNFTEIVKAARQNGIKVIPLEESEHSWRQLDKGGAIRSAVFSLNAKKVIDQNVGSKWLALVGSSHLNTYYGIPGICDIVQGAQDLLITDTNESLSFQQSLEVNQVPTDIEWAAEDPSEGCIKASISLIIDYRSEMSFGDIPTNILAKDFSRSSSGSAAAAEDREVKRPRQEEGQKESKESEEDRSRLEKEVKGPSGYFPIPIEAQRVKAKAKGNSSPGKGL